MSRTCWKLNELTLTQSNLDTYVGKYAEYVENTEYAKYADIQNMQNMHECAEYA